MPTAASLVGSLRRVFLSLLLLVIISTTLSACALLPSGNKDEKVTLKYWGIWEPSTVMNPVIEEYKKIKPNVTIVYEKKPPQQYRETLQSFITQGKGPDVFVFHNTWTPMIKAELAQMPSSVMNSSTFSKTYFPAALVDLRNSDKKLVGIPSGIDGLALYYNEDILKAAGFTTPPATWQELVRVATQLTVRDATGNIRTAGVSLGTASNVDHFSDILGLMVMQNGGDLKNPIDKASADALEFYANFAKGVTKVWDETQPASTVSFAGGNLAMYLAPSWRAIEIKNANPTLNFRAAPVPQLEGGKIAWASYWATGVSAKSANQKESWEFVKYLQEESTLIKLYSEAAKSPGRFFGEPYPTTSLATKLTSDPIVGAYVADAPFMRSFPMASQTHDNGLNDQIIKAYEDAINAVVGGTPAQNALDTAAKNIQNTLTRYGAK